MYRAEKQVGAFSGCNDFFLELMRYSELSGKRIAFAVGGLHG